jgi:hypothetical protein
MEKKPTKQEIYEVHDALMRQEYFDPIERFPDRIDQLLEAINRVRSFWMKFECHSFCFSFI